MSEVDPRLKVALEQLVARFGDQPEVTLIDIGYAPGDCGGEKSLVLRIHTRKTYSPTSTMETAPFPSQVGGFPVVLIAADYKLEEEAQPDHGEVARDSPATSGKEGVRSDDRVE